MLRKTSCLIFGSGSIGMDLMYKINRSPVLHNHAIVGRRKDSPGLKLAEEEGQLTSDQGVEFVKNNCEKFDVIFDATSASAHRQNAALFKAMGKVVVDLTPAKVGVMCVPSVNTYDLEFLQNINMVTCGGQATIPIIYSVAKKALNIDYVEIVSTISSESAGSATRENISEYLSTTESAIKKICKVKNSKAILNLNPSRPPVAMQSTIYIKGAMGRYSEICESIERAVKDVKSYVPGFELLYSPILECNTLIISIKVIGMGDYLPVTSGNLDIINCAALKVVEEYAAKRLNAVQI